MRGGGGGGGRGGGAGGGGFGAGGRAQPVDKLEALTKEFKLTPAQQTALQAIFDDAQKQTAPLVEQATAEQTNLLKLEVAGQDSTASVQKLAAIRTQIKMVEVDAFTKALAKLDDNQKKKAAKLYEMTAGMFVTRDWRRTT
jgi:Spy/CpxP family protein refolding chaperone